MESRPTCKIAWVDKQGKPTPDSNPAVGEAWIISYTHYHHMYLTGKAEFPESEHFPICAEHLKRFQEPGMQYWRFEPYV
jgi:hypothetical protein